MSPASPISQLKVVYGLGVRLITGRIPGFFLGDSRLIQGTPLLLSDRCSK